jgi:GNAT superfamily N-acetyltransferase
VCKIIDGVVWVESLFVSEQERRKGIATRLYLETEKVAQELGNSTLYNWGHPNNDKMIAFLSRMGYDVLNLIEVRKKLNNEEITGMVKVGDHDYHY